MAAVGTRPSGSRTHSALSLGLRFPEEVRFIAAASPLLLDVEHETDFDAYAKRHPARARKIAWLRERLVRYLSGPAAWDRHDPLRLAQREAGEALPPTYLCCGAADEFGFFEGSRLLASTLERQGAEIRYDEVPGHGHSIMTGEFFTFLCQD